MNELFNRNKTAKTKKLAGGKVVEGC